MKKWCFKETDANLALMCEVLDINEITARVIANRGIRSKKAALRYLDPALSCLHNGKLMKDMDAAVEKVRHAVACGYKIAIYGDYDVDGVMSVVILYKTLKEHGAEVIYYIPEREEEGYGLNKQAIEALREEEVDLLITCDNGIAALEEVDWANKLGMEVVIIDHHEPGYVEDGPDKRIDVIPNGAAIVDPKQQACLYPFKHLCAAGLCYKFAEQFYKAGTFDPGGEYLILAAIATVCDIVDLLDENRVLVKNGLEAINSAANQNIGLKALIKERALVGKKITPFDIGFIIGPCINATGRLESALLAVELFTTQDQERAAALAGKLVALNQERKDMTAQAVEKALNGLQEAENIDKVLVIYDEEIHESIAGIVAGRIKEAYYRPTIVLTRSGEEAKGSARSIESYNIFEELFKCRGLFERFGGHAMAAGLSLKKENIPILRKELNERCALSKEDFIEVLQLEQELELSQATYELTVQLKRLEPFGKANKEPLFASRSVQVTQLRVLEEKNTLIFTFAVSADSGASYRSVKGICFGQDKLASLHRQLSDNYVTEDCEKIWSGILRTVDLNLDIVYSLDINVYNNNVSVQLKIADFVIVPPGV